MTDRGEWFVCLVNEGAVSALYKQVLEIKASMWRKREPWRPGVEKVIVRSHRPLTLEYVKRRLTAAVSLAQWRGEVEYQASQETRVAVQDKLKKDYIEITPYPKYLFTPH